MYLQSTALADATTMSDATSADNNHIPELGPQHGHLPNKLVADTRTFQYNTWMQPIDVTTGNWVQLPLFKTHRVQGGGKLDTFTVYALPQLSMEQIIGQVNVAMDADDVANDSAYSYDNSMFKDYSWGKLKSIEVHCKNFLVSIERDSSGGIQWKDEPVFEVMAYPLLNWGDGSDPYRVLVDSTQPVHTYTTTLKEGLKTGCSFDMGLIYRPQCWGVLIDGTDRYVKYLNLGCWINNSIPQNISGYVRRYNPHVQLQNPFYAYYIRLINIPRGLSNIKVNVGFSSELRVHWYLTARHIGPLDEYVYFPPEGHKLGQQQEGVKRKRTERAKRNVPSLLEMLQ